MEEEQMPQEQVGNEGMNAASSFVNQGRNMGAHAVNGVKKGSDLINNYRDKKNDQEKEKTNPEGPQGKKDNGFDNGQKNNEMPKKKEETPNNSGKSLATGNMPKNNKDSSLLKQSDNKLKKARNKIPSRKKSGLGSNQSFGNKNKEANKNTDAGRNPATGIGPKNNLNSNSNTKEKNDSENSTDQIKDKGKNIAKKGAKQAGKAVAKGIKKLWRMIPIVIRMYIIIGVALFFLVFMLLFIIFGGTIAVAEEESRLSSNACFSSSGSSNLISFLNGWEGDEGTCTVNGKDGYLAADTNDGKITIGHGVTSQDEINADYIKTYIDQNNWGEYFKRTEGPYYVDAGDCVPKEVIDSIQIYAIEERYGKSVDKSIEQSGMDITSFQRDALISFEYNLGSGATRLLDAYKAGSYEGLWNVMKEYTKSGGRVLDGLKKRRKGEFSLFVTGNYDDAFYDRSLENYDTYNPNEYVVATGSSGSLMSNACVNTANGEGLATDPSTGFIMRTARPLRTNSFYYYQDENNYGRYLEGECAMYATARAQEVLASIGSSKTWTSNTNGGSFCSSDSSNNFKKSYDYTKPKQGAIISWGNNGGNHVAVVEKVNSDGSILISEMYVSLGVYATRDNAHAHLWETGAYYNASTNQYDRKYNCEANNSGCFQTQTLSTDKIRSYYGGGADFTCYIYLVE